MEEVVIIVGAGPSGVATSACLNVLSIPNIILEREDCFASLWEKRTYDRLKLHLGKQFFPTSPHGLPGRYTHFHSQGWFSSVPAGLRISHFQINPRYHRYVESASYDTVNKKWHIVAKNTVSDKQEVYLGKFLLVATGENGDGLIPNIPGLDSFGGEFMHCTNYKNGKKFADKQVLVVGCGNSGMEIAYDLWDYGATTSIVVRNPVHVLTKEMVLLGMSLLKYIPARSWIMLLCLAKLVYGDLSSYGLPRPSQGPFYLKDVTLSSPVIDVGTVEKIKEGEIQVVPAITKIDGDYIYFSKGKMSRSDAIIFPTGYKSTVLEWLKGDEDLFKEVGMPKRNFPNHWMGENGLYCAGFASQGLFGIARDAEHIANHICDVEFASRGEHNFNRSKDILRAMIRIQFPIDLPLD